MKERNVSRVKEFDFWPNAGLAYHLRHASDASGRVDDNLTARIHGIQVERADVGLERDDMLDTLLRR
jgi:hypothetical protein